MEPEHPLVKTFLAIAYFNQGRVDEAQALVEEVLAPEPPLRRAPAGPRAGACRPAGEHERARAVITERVKETAAADHDIALWLASLYAMEGMVDEGDRVGAPRRAPRQRELPALRQQPEARRPAQRPALRRAPRGAAGHLGVRAAARRDRERRTGGPPGPGGGTVTAPKDLLERIQLRLDESFAGIGAAVADLPPADLADLAEPAHPGRGGHGLHHALGRRGPSRSSTSPRCGAGPRSSSSSSRRARRQILDGPVGRPAHRDRAPHGRASSAGACCPSSRPRCAARWSGCSSTRSTPPAGS